LGYFLLNSSAALILAEGSAADCTFIMASCSPFEICGALFLSLSCAKAKAASAAISAHTANARATANDFGFMDDLVEMDFSTRLRAGGSNGKRYSAVSPSPLQAQGCGFLGIGRQRRGGLGSLSFWTSGYLVPPARRSLK